MKYKPAAFGLVIIATVLVVGFLLLRVQGLQGDLQTLPPFEPERVAVSAGFYAAALLVLAFLWRIIVCRLDDIRPPLLDSLTVFCATWLGRYVPGGLPYIAGKVAMGSRLGHSTWALGASLAYENVILICVGACLSAALVPLLLIDAAPPLVFASAGLAGICGLVLLSPPVLGMLTGLASRLARRPAIKDRKLLPYGGMASAGAVALVALAVSGAGFAILLSAFGELSVREAVAAGAVYNLAGVAGILVLPVPSGLGIREAVLIGLLQVFVPVPVAAAAAVLARLVGLAVDVAIGALSAGIFTMRRVSRSTPGAVIIEPDALDAA